MTSENNTTTIIDLSAASDHRIRLILLTMPAKELLKYCSLISRQWYRILHNNSFWIEKSEHDGYKLEWPRFSGLSLQAFQNIAAKHPFGRNFVRDSWDLSKQSRECYQPDPRWWISTQMMRDNDTFRVRGAVQIEVPPILFGGLLTDPDTGEDVAACLATSYPLFRKRIVIELAKEGLTAEIMDNFRPTIVVSELVSNRRDCGSEYFLYSQLERTMEKKMTTGCQKTKKARMEEAKKWEEERDQQQPSYQNHFYTHRSFAQLEEEGWRKVEHMFKNYSPGMRYLVVDSRGKDTQWWAGNYGVKMAKICVKALCESNA